MLLSWVLVLHVWMRRKGSICRLREFFFFLMQVLKFDYDCCDNKVKEVYTICHVSAYWNYCEGDLENIVKNNVLFS